MKPCIIAASVIHSLRYYGPFFWPPGNMTIHFLVKKPSLIQSPVNKANFFGPISDRINGVVLFFQINQQSKHFFFLITQQTWIIFSKRTLPVIYVRSRSNPSSWYLLLFWDIYRQQQQEQIIFFHWTLYLLIFTWSFQLPTRNYNFDYTFYKLHPTAPSHFQMR